MGEGKKENRVRKEFSSGGVVFKKDKWLITRSMPSEIYPKSVWRLPKGWVDKDESAEEAALREVKEEGGVETEVLGKVGNEKYFFVQDKQKIFKTVTFYLMEYIQEAEGGFSWETEELDWLPFKEAKKRLAFEKEKEILEKARELLGKGGVA